MTIERTSGGSPAIGQSRLQSPLWLLLLFLLPAVVLVSVPADTGPPVTPFGLAQVITKAQALAASPFQPLPDVPEALRHVGYDQWREIRFKKAQAVWRTDHGRFTVEFFHPGALYEHPVNINTVDATGVRPVKFTCALFDYGKTGLAGKVPADLGFAGFRIHYPLNRADYFDEVAEFLGASYFRAVAKGQRYGLSARGLAINTALPEGEEFPFFREFWLVKPAAHDREITVFALLDSPSLTGAYEFKIHPGDKTTMHVTAVLCLRRAVKKLGLAPLTSMFYCGENAKCAADFRPEIHDSDGLLIDTPAGEWIWRPLVNPQRLRIYNYSTGIPAGFGLLQRDQEFDHYQDLEARYDLRPSLWVIPDKGWDKGQIELVELPTQNEYHDNIIAYWSAVTLPGAGGTLRFSYRLEWYSARENRSALGQVVATRLTEEQPASPVRFVIDFQGDHLQSITSTNQLQADIQVGAGYKLEPPHLIRNTVTDGWRLAFQLTADPGDALRGKLLPSTVPPVDVRAVLKHDKLALTEIWNYSYPP